MASLERGVEITIGQSASKWLKAIVFSLILICILLRFTHLEADFPARIDWSTDLYTDEGWYSGNAIAWALSGNWYVAGDFNSIITLPVFQLIQMASFRTLGVSLFSARISVALLSSAMLILTFLLTRKLADELTAWTATLLLAVNFFIFAFSRLALLEIPITVFTLASLLLVFSWPRSPYLAATLGGLAFAAAVLTKTTALPFLPALMYAAWIRRTDAQQTSRKERILPLVVLLTSLAIFLSIPTVYALARYNADYRYLTTANVELRLNSSPISILVSLGRTLYHGIVVDKLSYPLTLASLVLFFAVSSQFRHSRMVTISLLWLIPYFAFLATRSYLPPRYYVPVSLPIIMLFSQMAVMAYHKLKPSGWSLAPFLIVAVVVLFNLSLLINYLGSLQYSFRDMGRDIWRRVGIQPGRETYLIGNLANSISLVTGIPSVNTELGTQDLKWKLQRYHPEYFVSLGGEKDYQKRLNKFYDIQELASYDVFGNYQRDKHVYLYRLVAKNCP